jgi:ribose transport system ATP-binding protein
MVEIARVFNIVKDGDSAKEGHGAIILLDEPTSVLNEDEVQNLFRNIRRICAAGNSIVFVSHRLDEVLEISDRIYVFKDGENVDVLDGKDADESILYKKMVGHTAIGEYYKVDRQTQPGSEILLELKELGKRGFFRNVSFSLRRGEVLGICGVIGSGKENLCSVICGDESPTSGTMLVRNLRSAFDEPHQALKLGILSIPKERREEGVIAQESICENIVMSNYGPVKRHGLISMKDARSRAEKYVKDLAIKCSSVDQRVASLSGGNAQKVVFGRILESDADILLLNHPTRGVDIGAKEEIYSLVRKLTEAGKSVILLGDTLDECIGLSSRIIVMKDGEITKEFDASPGNKPEQLDIVKYMM